LRERQDPVGVLRRKRRTDAGRQSAMSEDLRQALLGQYAAHKSWSAQLHHDNLAALVAGQSALGPMPSYSTVRRFLRRNGLDKRRPATSRQTAGALAAEVRLATREVRSFEVEHVGGLWHFDYHHGSRKVLTPRGEWQTPILLGILDDRSRLACHLQWYLAETAENLIHGLVQAFMKRGLPRAIMSDNGAAMTAAETTQGFVRLSILHETTLPYSPYQNAKQEAFWGPVEGRRFEVPKRYRHLTGLDVRYAGWDLSQVHLADEHTGAVLCRLYPLDKTKNADGLRRSIEPVGEGPVDIKPATGLPPLLAKMLDARAATGLPPAYLIKDEGEDK
jgi:transposase InsO family protein